MKQIVLIENDLDLIRYLKTHKTCFLMYNVDDNYLYVKNSDVEIILNEDISALSIMTEMGRQLDINFDWY